MHWFSERLIFYPTLCWNILLGRILRIRPWWSRVDQHVFIGALPFVGDVTKLKNMGIGAVVNTCREYPGPKAAYAREHIEQLYLPTVDFTAPRLQDIERGVKFIERHVAEGTGVYIHCKAGRGRSATIVVCWLIAAKAMTPEQAQRFLSQKRPHVHRQLYLRPVVCDFYKRCRS